MPNTDDVPSSHRQGFLKEDFRLFHLKDQGGCRYDFHYHDFLKIMLLISGDVTYVIEGRSYRLSPGDLVFVDRGQIHRPQVGAGQPYERIILYLSADFIARHSQGEERLDYCFHDAAYRHSSVLRLRPQARAPLSALFSRLEEECSPSRSAFAAPLYARLLCLELLIELGRLCRSPDSLYLTDGALDYRIAGLMAYINDHLEEELSIERLSSVCSLSPYHMMRRFKEETGCTVGSYISEKRLLRARSLLSQGINATRVSLLCGFGSYASFLRAYKRRFSSLPRQRKNM